MAKFVVLNENNVINLIVADDIKTAEFLTKLKCIEYSDPYSVYIGWVYDENTNTFSNPNEVIE